jgi:hypothetical protein
LQWWFHCPVIHSYEASLELMILFGNSWWVTAERVDRCIKWMSTLSSSYLTTSAAPINTAVHLLSCIGVSRCG